MLVLEQAPDTKQDVEPGWTDTFSIPLGIGSTKNSKPARSPAYSADSTTRVSPASPET